MRLFNLGDIPMHGTVSEKEHNIDQFKKGLHLALHPGPRVVLQHGALSGAWNMGRATFESYGARVGIALSHTEIAGRYNLQSAAERRMAAAWCAASRKRPR